jgi:rubredoxin
MPEKLKYPRCPDCGVTLEFRSAGYRCPSCGFWFQVDRGVVSRPLVRPPAGEEGKEAAADYPPEFKDYIFNTLKMDPSLFYSLDEEKRRRIYEVWLSKRGQVRTFEQEQLERLGYQKPPQ